ncbi:MAG TPA: RHS repeat-associated core domain-containing protein [Thermoanaerobaculia bacterium]|nr:RHS repeat-associated core domain-containing protein [Thermoanaerobaculia bacterium]
MKRNLSWMAWIACATLLVPVSAKAQSCADPSLPAFVIALAAPPSTGNGCGNPLKVCQTPVDEGHRIDVVENPAGVFEARLVVRVRAPWNSDSATLSSAKLHLFWQAGATASHPTTSLCQNNLSDRLETWLAFPSLSCGGAPYNLGVYSLRAIVCQNGGSCQKITDFNALPFTVTKQMLGCPEPAKWSCGGDSTCRDCLAVGPGFASPAGEGASASPPFSGPGATLRYRAGGAGGPGWPGTAAWNQTLGRYWSHDYAERIVQDPGAGHVWLITRHATFREFTDANLDGNYETVSPSDEYRELVKVPAGWELRDLDDTVQSFDSSGFWTQTVDRNGNQKTAQYTGGVLTRVTFPDGRREDFTYLSGKLRTITEVGVDGATSRTWIYTWSGLDLIRIDRPDGTAWELFYSTNPSLGGYLTRIDLRGTGTGSGRVETAWEYDAKGNVTKIWRGDPVSTGPNAVDLHVFTYDKPALPAHTVVTDPFNRTAVYDMERDSTSRKPRMKRVQSDCASCGLGPVTNFEYGDATNPLLPTAIVDAKSHRTELAYNADGRLTSRTEAVGTPLVRETTWEYHPVFRSSPTRIERPSTAGAALRETLMNYDTEGNLLTRTEQGMEDGSSFALTTTMTYNTTGQMLTIDPPGHGVADVTTFAYDSTRGDLIPLSRTDPIIGMTVFGHDAFNRRTGVTDVNGVAAFTAYDLLNRATLVIQDGGADPDLMTTYEYDLFGDLFRTIHPEGNVLEYAYDGAGRLTSLESKPDSTTTGERTLYALDEVGHRVREDLQSWNGSAWVTESWTEFLYSSKCHLDKVIRPGGAVTEHTYDCNGNLEKVWDANHPSASSSPTQLYAYDSLDRLTSVTQPWTTGTAVTSYGYDNQDHLKQVTDAEGNVTTYTYSDRDLLIQEISPVSGIKTYAYNEHGELVEETDARGITVLRDLDELDRVTTVSYPDPTLDVTYAYDTPGAFAKGRLTGITRHGETIAYDYDRFGRMTRDGDLTYSYDSNGNRTTIDYPEDIVATYTYDHADRQKSLSVTVDGGPALSLASAATYKPFGPLSSLALGNGLTETRTYDQRYQPATIQVGGLSPLLHWSYTTDNVGNITAISDQVNPANNRSYGYQDVLYFLTQGNGPWGPRAWTYDKIGNRLTESRGALTDAYTYPTNPAGGRNPKLLSVTPSREYSYDEAGNTLQILDYDADQQLGLIHDGAGRLSFLRSILPEDGLVSFTYDGRGYMQKAEDKDGGCFAQRTLATYNSEGLLHRREHRLVDGPGSVPVDSDTILYFAGRPVANLGLDGAGSSLVYLSTDHLGTPVLATGDSGGVLWHGGFEPFGGDYSGAQEAGIFLRFPGQWEDDVWESTDVQSGLYYNLFRWYDAQTGRYARRDPLDEVATAYLGWVIVPPMSTYSYAGQRPLSRVDPLGLVSTDPGCTLRWTLAGGLVGSITGGVIGATGGGAACSLFAPGVGTVGCGAGGGVAGAKAGAALGASLGFLIGKVVCECDEEDEDRDGLCEQIRIVDEGTCAFFAARKDWRLYRACMSQAAVRYAECRRFGAPRSPLFPSPFGN